MSNTFDRIGIKQRARQTLRDNRGLCIAITVVYMAVSVGMTFLSLGILQAIIGPVLSVALAGFFLAVWQGHRPTIGDFFSSAFDSNFLRKLGGILWMVLFTFLWMLLLYIPGFVKMYAYFLTPYILHDCPNVKAKYALKLSMRMTRGHKGELFVAQLSFLGWGLLSGLTFGILAVLFTIPYMCLTFAGIYDELKKIALEDGVVSQRELDGLTEV